MADASVLGADLLLPDLQYIEDLGERLQGYVLTHGHEDHIAALPHALKRRPAPVVAPAYVLRQLENRLAAHGLGHLTPRALVPGQALTLGSFVVETAAVAHSIPDSTTLCVTVGGARLVFSGDFRVDLDPVDGAATDLQALQALGDLGVTVLVSDSTGAMTPGDNPGERSVHEALHRAVAGSRGRVVVTTFTSHIHRMRQLFEIAVATGRRIVLLGRAATENVALARRAGILSPAPGLVVDVSEAMDLPPSQLMMIATGCQGEPRAALARLARGARELPPVEPGDRVVFSARVIPGNEISALRVANQLVRRGAELVFGDAQVHVSGHGYQGDLAELLRRVRPRIFMPVHGDRMHLEAHAVLGEGLGLSRDRIAVVENGQPVELYRDGAQWHYRGGPPEDLETFVLEHDKAMPLNSQLQAARHNAARRGVLAVAVPLHGGRPGPCRLNSSGVDSRVVGAILIEAQAEVDRDLSRLDRDEQRDAVVLEQAVVAAIRRVFRRRGARAPQAVVLLVPA